MSGTDGLRLIDRWSDGVGWLAHPDERLQRASHALEGPEGLWLVDPVDAVGLDGLLADRGPVRGVVVLLDRHRRDAGAIARRHGVAVAVPAWFDGVAEAIDAPVERFEGALPGTAYDLRPVIDRSWWQEGALFDGATLVVPEALGTASYYLAPGERLGVSPVLRLYPPRRVFAGLAPERLRLGHGAGIGTDAAGAIEAALAGARRRLPALAWDLLRSRFRPTADRDTGARPGR